MQPRTDHEEEQFYFENAEIEDSNTSESDANQPTVGKEDEELTCDVTLSTHDSDNDPTESDSDSESDAEGQRTHKKSITDQIKRKVKLLKVLPYKTDIFPPRPPREWKGGHKGRGKGRLGWHGGRRRGLGGAPHTFSADEQEPLKSKMKLRERAEARRNNVHEEADGNDDSEDDHRNQNIFIPHPRNRVVDPDLRRGRNRPFMSLNTERGKEKRHKETDKFMNYCPDQQLDYAARVFRYLENLMAIVVHELIDIRLLHR